MDSSPGDGHDPVLAFPTPRGSQPPPAPAAHLSARRGAVLARAFPARPGTPPTARVCPGPTRPDSKPPPPRHSGAPRPCCRTGASRSWRVPAPSRAESTAGPSGDTAFLVGFGARRSARPDAGPDTAVRRSRRPPAGLSVRHHPGSTTPAGDEETRSAPRGDRAGRADRAAIMISTSVVTAAGRHDQAGVMAGPPRRSRNRGTGNGRSPPSASSGGTPRPRDDGEPARGAAPDRVESRRRFDTPSASPRALGRHRTSRTAAPLRRTPPRRSRPPSPSGPPRPHKAAMPARPPCPGDHQARACREPTSGEASRRRQPCSPAPTTAERTGADRQSGLGGTTTQREPKESRSRENSPPFTRPLPLAASSDSSSRSAASSRSRSVCLPSSRVGTTTSR
ncbi:hypothetical protein AHOG_22510 [Actinoalloteichus hoggarensis]|uniref:Uncharacterized protein n=1 Tax=Actinoalloteichus hoggarensis TaxID=1470176 RepID=A0A221W881_9PSEU|nr:hypothetical protein AHOG_22510 [Actinoalloteichus hoggarensis]